MDHFSCSHFLETFHWYGRIKTLADLKVAHFIKQKPARVCWDFYNEISKLQVIIRECTAIKTFNYLSLYVSTDKWFFKLD